MRNCFLIWTMLATSISCCVGEEYTIDFDAAPATQYLDRWVYPFNVTPGSRIQSPTFGAVGSEGFDDRDGQFLLAVNTQAIGIPVGSTPSLYSVESLRITMTESVGGYRFDSTADSFSTYLDPGTAQYEADADVGRPIEMFGIGFRNDFEEFGFPDGGTSTEAPVFSAGSPFGTTDRGTRNVFAADATGRDVSNNVDSLNSGIDGFDPIPFAVGQAVRNEKMTAPGTEIIAGDEFVFDVDVSNPEILRYVQTGLAEGQLGFVVTSMHGTGVMGAGDPFVNLATSNHFAFAAPVIEIEVTVNDGLAGDFDMDGMLTALDIDRLALQVRNGGFDAQFDLNADSKLNADDHRNWVEQAFGTYYGDSNLDGEFNSSDFVAVFTASEYEDSIPANSTWATGDWNGDGDFDTKDFVLAFQSSGYEQGPRLALAVPEPSVVSLLVMSGVMATPLFCRFRATGR